MLLIVLLTLSSCRTTTSFTPKVYVYHDLYQYPYAYIIPTNNVTSGTGGITTIAGGVYGLSSTNSINPSSIISGYLMQKGFAILPSIDPELADHTMVVSFGDVESTSNMVDLVAKNIVIIQIRDAASHNLIASADAMGESMENNAAALKIAIHKALDSMFFVSSIPEEISDEQKEALKKELLNDLNKPEE